jgi:hypothetical protein
MDLPPRFDPIPEGVVGDIGNALLFGKIGMLAGARLSATENSLTGPAKLRLRLILCLKEKYSDLHLSSYLL